MNGIIQIKQPVIVPAPPAVVEPEREKRQHRKHLGLEPEKRQVEQDSCCQLCRKVTAQAVQQQNEQGAVQKCELCLENISGYPACVEGCPNRAIVFEER